MKDKVTTRLFRPMLIAVAISNLLLSGPSLAGTVTFAYDPLGRVVKVTNPDGKQTCFNYDKAGNRTQVVVSSSTCTPAAMLSSGTATDATTLSPLQTDDSEGSVSSEAETPALANPTNL